MGGMRQYAAPFPHGNDAARSRVYVVMAKETPRKLIGFDPETASALKLLAADRMMTLQELADEAFSDLLKKHGRPVSLKEALKQSLRTKASKTEQTRRH